jgi:hypothetical protein
MRTLSDGRLEFVHRFWYGDSPYWRGRRLPDLAIDAAPESFWPRPGRSERLMYWRTNCPPKSI